MNFDEILLNEPKNHTSQKKSQKIYIVGTRKSYNTNRKKLNQILQISSQTIHQSQKLPLEGSIKRYLTSDKTEITSLKKSYEERPKKFNIWEKHKEIKPSTISDHYLQSINTLSNTQKRQKFKKYTSLNINISKLKQSPDLDLIKIQQSCGDLPSLMQRQKNTLHSSKKKKSYPYSNKRRSISFSDETNNNPIHLKHRQNLPQYQFSPQQEESMLFLKNGKVNGHKIYNLLHQGQNKNYQTLRSQENHTSSLHLSSSNREARHIIQKYFSLIKNTDYGRMTKHSGKKVIKNHLEILKAKRSNQKKKQSMIDHVYTQTFIKVQSIFSVKNKAQTNL